MTKFFKANRIDVGWNPEDVNDYSPLAQCDISSLPVKYTDLRKQMIWAGGDLVWNGLWGHKDFIDDPNPFWNPMPVFKDPRPVMFAKPFQTKKMEPPFG